MSSGHATGQRTQKRSNDIILLDAFAVIAFLRDEPAADEVGDLIGSGDAGLLAPNVAEISDRLVRVYDQAAERVRDGVETLASTSGLTLRGVTVPDGWRAAAIRSRHYHRTDCPISLADSFLLACAGPDDRIATADPPLLNVARAERIAWTALEDSRGLRHPPG
jgi:uncharacterized protein with PIN domain